MVRVSARNVRPSLSDDSRDKLAAALGWHYGRFKESREYQMAPIYFDMLVEWHEKLTPDQQETCLTLADVIASAHKGAAESMAAHLPPAPRCPL
jgi:hypothetical protein